MIGRIVGFLDDDRASHAPCSDRITEHVDLEDHMAARPDEHIAAIPPNPFEAIHPGEAAWFQWLHHPMLLARTRVHTFMVKVHELTWKFAANLVALHLRKSGPLMSVR